MPHLLYIGATFIVCFVTGCQQPCSQHVSFAASMRTVGLYVTVWSHACMSAVIDVRGLLRLLCGFVEGLLSDAIRQLLSMLAPVHRLPIAALCWVCCTLHLLLVA